MNYKYLLYLGLGLTFTSLIGMIYTHEFAISEGIFIIGIIITGFAYAKGTRLKPEINIDRVNKNIGILNDILWGKQQKEQAIKLTPEQYWQIATQDKCESLLNLHNRWKYCLHKNRICNGCWFEKCPKRLK